MKVRQIKSFLRNVKFDFMNRIKSFDFISKIYSKYFFRTNFYFKYLNNVRNLNNILVNNRFFFLFSKFVFSLKIRLKFFDFIYKDKALMDFFLFSGFFSKNVLLEQNCYSFFFNKNKIMFDKRKELFSAIEPDLFLYENDKGNVIKLLQGKFFILSFFSFERFYSFKSNIFNFLKLIFKKSFFFFFLVAEIYFFLFYFVSFFSNFYFFVINLVNLSLNGYGLKRINK